MNRRFLGDTLASLVASAGASVLNYLQLVACGRMLDKAAFGRVGSLLALVATWAAARLWLGRRVGVWAALVLAVLPTDIFFALTEVHFVPGALFAVGSLALLGLAIRDRLTRAASRIQNAE